MGDMSGLSARPFTPEAARAARWEAAEQRADVRALHALGLSMALPPPGAAVLDAGCGAGGAAAHLAKAVGPLGTVIGVDPSELMLERAARYEGGPVRFERGDVLALRYPTGEFDLVRGTCVLSECLDPRGAVDELVRVCRPGGRLMLLDVDWQSLSVDLGNDVLVDAVLGIVPRKGPSPRAGFEMRRLVVEAGCAEVRVSPYTLSFTDLEDAAELLVVLDQDQPADLCPVPARLREAWFTALEHADMTGRLLVSLTAWVVSARAPG